MIEAQKAISSAEALPELVLLRGVLFFGGGVVFFAGAVLFVGGSVAFGSCADVALSIDSHEG